MIVAAFPINGVWGVVFNCSVVDEVLSVGLAPLRNRYFGYRYDPVSGEFFTITQAQATNATIQFMKKTGVTGVTAVRENPIDYPPTQEAVSYRADVGV